VWQGNENVRGKSTESSQQQRPEVRWGNEPVGESVRNSRHGSEGREGAGGDERGGSGAGWLMMSDPETMCVLTPESRYGWTQHENNSAVYSVP